MKHARRAVLVLLVAAGGVGVGRGSGADRAAEEAPSPIVGTWRGHSVCLVKSSPCHDEVNVYRFSKIPGKPASFSLTASKVVDGKEIVMGSGECTHDAVKLVVECKAAGIRLAVEENRMEGTLTLPDGTVYRRIDLKKGN
jgi:hypothetical protein